MTTVALIAWLASALFDQVEQQRAYVNVLAIVLLVLMTPVCACIAHHNHNTRQVLRHGWWPILVSMILSSLAGMILDKAVALFVGFALVQPLINGVGGNLAAIQASRISTFLHRTMTDREFVQKTCRTKQMLNQQQVRLRENPKQEQIYVELFDSIENDDILPNAECKTIEISGGSIIADITSSTGVNPSLSLGGHRRRRRTLTREASVRMSERDFRQILLDSQCAKVLLLIALPLHVLYYFTIVAYKGSYSFDNQAYFLPVYLLVALVQMITLLHCARSLVYWMWDKKINPDDCSIPVLTAFGDLIGTSLLAIGFVLLNPTRFF